MDYNNNQQIELKQTNSLAMILSVIIAILLAYISYLYYSKDMIKKGDLESKYTLKSNIDFNTLPSYIQEQYVSKYKYDTDMSNSKNIEPKIIEKIVEVPKEIIKIKEVIKNINTTTKLDKSKYKSFQCIDMDSSGTVPSKECKQNLHKFLDKNKDSKLFEVIAMVNSKDFYLLSKLKNKYNKTRVKKLDNYAKLGLAQTRVKEGIWSIQEYLGMDTNIQMVNYKIDTKDDIGFIVRAYK